MLRRMGKVRKINALWKTNVKDGTSKFGSINLITEKRLLLVLSFQFCTLDSTGKNKDY